MLSFSRLVTLRVFLVYIYYMYVHSLYSLLVQCMQRSHKMLEAWQSVPLLSYSWIYKCPWVNYIRHILAVGPAPAMFALCLKNIKHYFFYIFTLIKVNLSSYLGYSVHCCKAVWCKFIIILRLVKSIVVSQPLFYLQIESGRWNVKSGHHSFGDFRSSI